MSVVSAAVARLGSLRLIAMLLAALLGATGTAGWALWRLAGCGSRCDARLADARLAGSQAVMRLAIDQQAALDVLRIEQDAELMRAWTMQSAGTSREVTKWRTRWRDAGPVTGCAVTPEQVAAINAALRNGGAE